MGKSSPFSWSNLTPQLVAIVILPLAILTLIVAFGGVLLHQNSMRAMVGERDERAVRAAAATLVEELMHRFDVINLLLDLAEAGQGVVQPSTSLQARVPVEDFNRGIAVLDEQGRLLWNGGGDNVWVSLTPQDVEHFQVAERSGSPLRYQVSRDSLTGEWVFFISSRENMDGMRLIGAHAFKDLMDQILGELVGSPGGSAAFVINPQGEVIYSTGDPEHISLSEHSDVSQALGGGSGSLFYEVGNEEHVVAYSSVLPFNWTIIVEEPWREVADPLLRRSEIAPLLVVPILLLALLAIWYGTRSIVQPLQRLEGRASALAWGDYETIEQPVGGIAEIQRLQSALIHMAHKVRTAQQGLRGYIGAITMGQEDERRRLSRELHDDTLQSLIALNQRLQLAELNSDAGFKANAFAEIRSLIEETIQNLRRFTRALRPIYLEDLGLTAALEMLVGEIEDVGDISIEFRKTGADRRLPETVELVLYRIAQEALNNVVHHATASQAALLIEFGDDHVLLEVSDDGRGFDVPESPAEMVPEGHYGLLGMYERAELVGASLEIRSKREAGTSVRLLLPHSAVENLPGWEISSQ